MKSTHLSRNTSSLSLLPLLIMVAIIVLSSCTKSYSVGDIYKSKESRGVVVAVKDGVPVMLLSLEEAVNIDADSAQVWSLSLNTDSSTDSSAWHLPSKEELAIVAQAVLPINESLKRKKLPTILQNNTWYWSATASAREAQREHANEDTQALAKTSSHVYAYGPQGMKPYFRENKSHLYRARAVRYLSSER